MMKGMNDRPIQFDREDKFSIRPYVEGLCSFIKECDTPISIAIQGDWGCGKTSMMNMLKNSLEKEDSIESVWFDTWQYSQFHMEPQMALTFMQHFVDSFGERKEENITIRKTKELLKALAVGAAQQMAGDTGAGAVEMALQKKNPVSFSEEVLELKKSFRELTAARVKEKGRLLFFIDDLDRLRPIVAVELLEILKLFFDCENCVFILAVDTEVIYQGLQEKYGGFLADDKAKYFFDKIIQLPFQLPVSQYKMEHLIEEALHVEIRSFYDKEWYFKAVHLLTNGNPRSIKRLANAFLLTDKVAESKGMYQETSEETGWRKKILFLLSGIQLNYPEVYTHMAFSSSYGFFFRLFTVPEDSRVSMQKVLEELKLIQDFLWKERILDVFLLLASTLQAYTKSGLGLNIYPFMRICDFCRIVDMNMEEPWEQPESDENLYIDESGEMLEITDPHGMYLYDRMDRVLSFHFEKEDVNAWDWTAVDYDYRYSLKVPTDWFFGIRFWGNEVFPSVYLNKEILEKEKTWGEEIQRLQRNLAFWYERLQDTFGKKAYQDKDFTGTEFLVYSKEQADCLVEDLLEIFSGEYTKEND